MAWRHASYQCHWGKAPMQVPPLSQWLLYDVRLSCLGYGKSQRATGVETKCLSRWWTLWMLSTSAPTRSSSLHIWLVECNQSMPWMPMIRRGTKGCKMRATIDPWRRILRFQFDGAGRVEDGTWSEPRPFKKGDVQHMIFQEGDGPPFYSPNLDPNKYVDKSKGIRQVLWERGLWSQTGQWVDEPGNKPVRDLSNQPSYRLLQCPDLPNQKSALQLKIESMGHQCES